MQPSFTCLQPDELKKFIAGDMAPKRVDEIEDHLSTCESCRDSLEATVGDRAWWQDLETALRSDTADGEYENTESKESVCQRLTALLGPTDDPSMLGRIGAYEIIGLLGYGGMGAVFKARDSGLNRYVAIKILLPHLASSGAARARFRREGQAAAAIIDDCVLPIHAVDEWQGIPYLVMQYTQGVSLQKRIHDRGPLELKEILRIGLQAARGLAAAHAQGLVHRDVKPSNILLDGSVDRALLTDFGLARAVDDASLTRSGTLAGTPQYMSPEQARAETVDCRSDLFSLGSVMYAMCTGHAPFRAESSYSVLRLITDKEPRPIREINPDVPEWLCAIVSKLMAKSSSDRFDTAKEVADLLNHCLAHVQSPSAVELPANLRDSTSRVYRFRKSKLFGVFVMGCFLIASLLLIMQIAVPPNKNKNEDNQDGLTQKPTATQQSNLDNEYHIAGKCVDEDDRPIENAVIELYEDERLKFKPVKTDANGAFDLGKIPDPELSTTGYVSYVVVGRAAGKSIGTALPFGYSGKPNELKVVLKAPGQIKGTVTGPDGAPVSGARVSIAGIPWIDGINGTVTNEAGEYVLDSIPLLKHPGLVRSRGPGVPKEGVMVPIEQRYLIVQHPSFGMFQPGYAECPATVNVNLEQPAILTGRVVDEKGLSIAGIKVSARASRNPVHRSVVGQSQLRGLSSGSSATNADGEYSIMLQYSGPIEISFSGTKHLAETVNDVVVHSGETVNAPPVTAVEPALVVGRIVDVDTNKTVACPKGVRLRVYSMGNGPVSTVIVQPDGTYRLPVLPGTNYVYFSIAPDSLQELTKLWDVLDHPNPLTAKQYPVEADKGKEAEVNLPVKVNKNKLGSVMVGLQGDWEIQGATYVASGNARVALAADSLLDGEKRPLRFTVHGNQWLGHSEDLCGVREPVLACFLCSGVAELTIDGPFSDAPLSPSGLTLTRFSDGEKHRYPCLFKLSGDQLELLCNASATNDRRQESWELAREAHVVVAKRLPTGTGTTNDGTPSSAAIANELDADARQAMSTHQNRLVWTNRFKFDSIRRNTHKELGRVEERSTLASDGKRFVHRHESLKMDQPANVVGRSLTSFGLYTGDSFMGGTCLTGQPMKTGGYSRQNAEEHVWGMRERTSMVLEGYRAGNAGQTILELLLKSKDLEVKKEKIGEIDCFRIKNSDEWGTNVAWIEAKGKNRLLQWESRKERGNKFSRSRHGEHRDTSNYESSGVRITGIEYREIDGTPIAIRGTYVSFHTPNGGQETVSSMEMERSNIELKPDFSSDSIFDPLYAEGARITDLDGTDPDKHFWWRNGQLVASDSVKSNQQSISNKPEYSK